MTEKKLQGVICAAFGCLVLISAAVRAEVNVKTLLAEDCARVLSSMPALDQKEKEELLAIVVLSLTLPPYPADRHATQDVIPPLRMGALDGASAGSTIPELLSLFDPQRDSKTKSCALEVLDAAGTSATSVLPELVQLAGKRLLIVTNLTLQEKLEETILQIALSASHGKQTSQDTGWYARLIEQLEGDGARLARAVLVELHEQALPVLLQTLAIPKRERRRVILGILADLDPIGKEIGPKLLALLVSGDEELRIMILNLLAALSGSYASSAQSIVKALDDPAAEVSVAALEALDRMSDLSSGPINLSQAECEILLRVLEEKSAVSRDVVGRFLSAYGGHIMGLFDGLLPLLERGDADLKARIVLLLGRVFGAEAETEGKLVELIDSNDQELQRSAIMALAYSTRRDRVVAHFLKFLKRNAARADATHKRQMVSWVAEALAVLKPGSEILPALPYFVEALSNERKNGARESELRIAALETVVVDMGKAAAPQLKGIIKRGSSAERVVASRALAKIEPSDKIFSSFIDAEMHGKGCSEYASISEQLVGVQGAGRELLRGALVKCLLAPQAALSALSSALLSYGPLSKEEGEKVLGIINSGALTPKSELALLRSWEALGLESAGVTGRLVRHVAQGDDSLRVVALQELGSMQKAAGSAVAALHEAFDQAENRSTLKHEVASALLRIDPQAALCHSYFTAELSGERHELAEKTLAQVDPAVALSILMPLVDGARVDIALRALRVLAEFGLEAQAVIPKIIPFLDNGEREIRQTATRTLLLIDAAHPRAEPALRRLLREGGSAILQSQQHSVAFEGLLRNIANTSPSMVERIEAHRALKR